MSEEIRQQPIVHASLRATMLYDVSFHMPEMYTADDIDEIFLDKGVLKVVMHDASVYNFRGTAQRSFIEINDEVPSLVAQDDIRVVLEEGEEPTFVPIIPSDYAKMDDGDVKPEHDDIKVDDDEFEYSFVSVCPDCGEDHELVVTDVTLVANGRRYKGSWPLSRSGFAMDTLWLDHEVENLPDWSTEDEVVYCEFCESRFPLSRVTK